MLYIGLRILFFFCSRLALGDVQAFFGRDARFDLVIASFRIEGHDLLT
jgi:hypothetical protein